MSRLADCSSPYDRMVNGDLAGRGIEINDMTLEADQSTLEAIARDVRAHAAEQSGYYLMSQDEFAEMVRRGGYPVATAAA